MLHRIVEKPSQTPRIYNPNHPEYWLTEQGKRNMDFNEIYRRSIENK